MPQVGKALDPDKKKVVRIQREQGSSGGKVWKRLEKKRRKESLVRMKETR